MQQRRESFSGQDQATIEGQSVHNIYIYFHIVDTIGIELKELQKILSLQSQEEQVLRAKIHEQQEQQLQFELGKKVL